MKGKKLLSSLIALSSISMALPAFANSGTQNYCDLVDSAVAANLTELPANELPVNAHPASAFCGGLQAHDEVSFHLWSEYSVSDDKEIMADSVTGVPACLTSTGISACNHIEFQPYRISGAAHPDYTEANFSGDPVMLPLWQEATFYPGDQAGVITDNSAIVKFAVDPNYDQSNPNSLPNTTYRLKTLGTGNSTKVYMSPGDYYIETLNLGSGAEILIEGEGTVRIHVKNIIAGNFSTLGEADEKKQLVIIVDGDLQLNNNTQAYAYIYASGTINVGSFAKGYGAFNATDIVLSASSRFYENITDLKNVDWGDLVANAAPGGVAPDPNIPGNRHSGSYNLHYDYQLDNGVFDESQFTNSLLPSLYASLLDPSNYIDSDALSGASLEAPTDSLSVGWVYGGITAIVGGIPWNAGWAIPVPVAPLDANSNAVLTEKDSIISEYESEWDNQDNYLDNDTANIYGHRLLVSDDGDDNPDNNPIIWYDTADARDDAVEAQKASFSEKVEAYFAGAVAEWNLQFDSLASSVEYKTFYPGGGELGVTGYGFNNGGAWIGVMNDNTRASVPVVFPVSLWPAVGLTPFGPAGAWCSAWVVAFEVGCFAPSADDVSPTDCKYWATGEDVDMALFAAAGANLTCGVFGPNFLFAGTVGMAISAAPHGTLNTTP